MTQSAISANSAQQRSFEDMRGAQRFTLLIRTAKLVSETGEFLCIIRDVSATGLRLRLFHDLPRGRLAWRWNWRTARSISSSASGSATAMPASALPRRSRSRRSLPKSALTRAASPGCACSFRLCSPPAARPASPRCAIFRRKAPASRRSTLSCHRPARQAGGRRLSGDHRQSLLAFGRGLWTGVRTGLHAGEPCRARRAASECAAC